MPAAVRGGRGWPLVITMAHDQPINTHLTSGPGTPPGASVDDAEWSHLREVGHRAQGVLPHVQVSTRYVRDKAVGFPAEESAAPGVVVIGTRGLGGIRSSLYGGVADKLAAAAQGPVVVVPSEANTDGPIVVGVDGDGSSAAVDWALTEARRLGAPVRIVRCWGYRETVPLVTAAALLPDSVSAVRAAQDEFGDLVARARAAAPDVEIEEAFTHGDPATVLVDESRHARLLVVGSRGRGRLAGLVLGSTSRRVLRDSRCPAAVVPDHVEVAA